ncbi:MFS transporter [Leucobacter weissii]|uniref:MFS transporter n=1 Tax=Leucobacter weissii TaxID=1983706 RepID=A0A939S8U8_9MICO|nr:MFS transporter [Leucobacter weissii]MBO1902486.1 MFS transporter [Leucobacter weissii]
MSASASPAHQPAGLASAGTGRGRAWPIVACLSLGGLAFSLLQSMVAPALPGIASDLGTDTASVSWVLTGYLLSASVCTPILGRLGDMVGKRRVLLGSLILLAVGCVAAALAPNLTVLIAARVLQGAAGAIMPLSIGMVRDLLPARQVPVTVGLLSALLGIGGGFGIVLAGPIVTALSWHWLFWLPLVAIAVAIAGVVWFVPESPVRSPGRLDWKGALILSAALVAVLLAVSKGSEWGWTSPATIALTVAGLGGLVVFVLTETRTREPLVDMSLLRRRGVWVTDLVGLLYGFLMYSTFLLIPLLVQLPAATGYGFGLTVTQAGLVFVPTTLMMLIFGPLSGLIGRRTSTRTPLILGAIAVTAGYLVPALGHDQLWQILTACVLTGAGVGLAFAGMSNVIIAHVPPTATGQATSVNTIVRTIGGSIGTATVAAILATHTTGAIPAAAGFTIVFWTGTLVGILAIVLSLFIPKPRHDDHDGDR